MCGIVGTISFRKDTPVEEASVVRMRDRLSYRGPDDAGVYVNSRKTVGLGHRRLSIIDLSPAGRMPMQNNDGTVWITYNGEVYNFQALRKECEQHGYTFRSNSDTEVLIYLWEQYGPDMVKKLRGMFAFAIWDENKQHLFLARDRAGQKPLKYYIDDNVLYFASELKAFLDEPGVPREVDLTAVHHYLTLQYAPAPLTGFLGIKKLPPAHTMLVDCSGPKPTTHIAKYWSLSYEPKPALSQKVWKERILDTMREAVRLRTISDVPLGAFLSGGVDSSAIVALLSEQSNRPVKTFSIGFEEKKYNELPDAAMVAKKFGTDHTEFVVQPSASELLDTLVYHYEEPFADSSALPTYLVSRLTREHVTVALNGDGGDENFAGYPWYVVHVLAQRYRTTIPAMAQRLIGAIGSTVARPFPDLLAKRAVAFFTSSLCSAPEQYHYYTSIFYPDDKEQLYNQAMRHRLQHDVTGQLVAQFYAHLHATHPLDHALGTDIQTYLPGALLPKVDIASMAVSLEARSPFLDHHVMELAASVPASLKLKGTNGKYILKEAFRGILPDHTLAKKKWGFRLPIESWFNGPLQEMAKEVFMTSPLFREHFDMNYIEKLLNEHSNTRAQHGRKLWSLLWLAKWYDRYFVQQ